MRAVSDAARLVVEWWYGALAAGDIDGVVAAFQKDVRASVVGTTLVSGRYEGRDAFLYGTMGVDVEELDPERTQFAKRWSIFAVDGPHVVGMMSGDAIAKSGHPYNGTYCQVFTIRGDQIVEYVEFVDTVLIEAALFDNHLAQPRSLEREPLSID
jgi:ketosteroid isomerase-like protein